MRLTFFPLTDRAMMPLRITLLADIVLVTKPTLHNADALGIFTFFQVEVLTRNFRRPVL
jgi:hypothetical protein